AEVVTRHHAEVGVLLLARGGRRRAGDGEVTVHLAVAERQIKGGARGAGAAHLAHRVHDAGEVLVMTLPIGVLAVRGGMLNCKVYAFRGSKPGSISARRCTVTTSRAAPARSTRASDTWATTS